MHTSQCEKERNALNKYTTAEAKVNWRALILGAHDRQVKMATGCLFEVKVKVNSVHFASVLCSSIRFRCLVKE